MGEAAFRVEARVREALPNGTFVAELANGHRLTAFVTGRDKMNFAGLRVGDAVKLQLTPYDLSVGRILVETKKI
ncbi:MAG: translation initiation factor IF-1 [Verrucomicrobiota bacterium]|jgi:translation initiation factor IF-1